jgi:predicted nucleotidyltransferase
MQLYPHINELLADLLAQMQTILGDKLVGLYLYGSLVASDFDDDISDIDLLAAITSDLDEREFTALQQMHNDFVDVRPHWNDRIEIAYLSLHALKTFKTERSKLGIISPGEPFHIIDAGADWLMNWYMMCDIGVTLFGPPPRTIIAHVSKGEFIEAVIDHMRLWRESVIHTLDSRPFQAYAILNMCRALYTIRHGEQVSKIRAAAWAEQELPEWSATIQNALAWRRTYREQNTDHEATRPQTLRFVTFMLNLMIPPATSE